MQKINQLTMSFVKEYKIYASSTPTKEVPSPQIFTSFIFAKNELIARSRFNRLMNSEQKIKSTKSVILKIEEIIDTAELRVRNFGINLKYKSKSGVHNIYKEVRATSRCSAISNLLNAMAGTHKVTSDLIDIIKIEDDVEPIRKKNIELSAENLEVPCFQKTLVDNKKSFVKSSEKYFN